MVRSVDRLDAAEGAVTIAFDEPLSKDIFALNCAVSGRVFFIGWNGLPGDVYIAAGIPFPLRAERILSEGTTAQDLRGLV